MLKRFTAGLAVGYVLGARAGQKRYDQIVTVANRVSQLPGVERLVDRGSTTAAAKWHRLAQDLKRRARSDEDGPAEAREERRPAGPEDEDEIDEDNYPPDAAGYDDGSSGTCRDGPYDEGPDMAEDEGYEDGERRPRAGGRSGASSAGGSGAGATGPGPRRRGRPPASRGLSALARAARERGKVH